MKKTNSQTSDYSVTFYLCLIFTLLTLSVFNISFYLFSKPKISYIETEPTNKEIAFWQTFLESHPSYLDGWIELTKLNIQNGDKKGAEVALQNAQKIDPNSIAIQNLKIDIKN